MNFTKLDKFTDELSLRGIPLHDLSVSLSGREVYRNFSGFRDHGGNYPVSRDTLYRIYSNSKIITCTAGMRLIEEGKLGLYDDVAKYLPSFKNITVKEDNGEIKPSGTPMKIIHLFTMTCGLDYNANSPSVLRARGETGADTVRVCSAMAREPLAFEPGTHWLYGHGIDVLGAVIEVVSGMKLSDYLKKIMFEPLELSDIGFHPTEEQSGRLAQAYFYNNAEGVSTPISNNDGYPLSERFESGGGGLFSSVDDYMKIISTLACGGVSPCGYRLLKEETIAEMEVNRLCPDAWRDFVGGRLYGYGWGLCGRVHVNPVLSMSKSSIGEFGWDGMHGAYSLIDRERQVAIYFSTQVAGCAYAYTTLHPLIRDLVFDALEGR